jgi:hypothetical protein
LLVMADIPRTTCWIFGNQSGGRVRSTTMGRRAFQSRSRRWRRRAAAGGSAQARFDVLLQRWRRRKRRAFAAVFGALTLPCIVVAALASGWWDFAATFLVGAWFGMAMWIWDSPPEHIERVRRGAEGERRTGRELKRLSPREWTVVHDLDGRFGNWDHVVVGPGGVFLLDSKHLFGDASVEGGCLVVRRVDAPEELSRFDGLRARMRGAAAGVSEALRDDRNRPWVTPVVVVWPELTGDPTDAGGVVYLSGRELARWLSERDPVLERDRRTTLAARLVMLANERPSRRSGTWARDALQSETR